MPIRRTVANVERYKLACLVLHNYLRLTDNAHYSPVGFIDLEDKEGNICPGEWRLMRCNQSENLQRLQPVRGSCIRQDVFQIRNKCSLAAKLRSKNIALCSTSVTF